MFNKISKKSIKQQILNIRKHIITVGHVLKELDAYWGVMDSVIPLMTLYSPVPYHGRIAYFVLINSTSFLLHHSLFYHFSPPLLLFPHSLCTDAHYDCCYDSLLSTDTHTPSAAILVMFNLLFSRERERERETERDTRAVF